MGDYLMDGFKNLMKTHSLIGDVRGRGLLMGFELVKNRETKEYATAEAVALMEKCREKGLLIGKGGLFGNVIRIAPPLSITQANCDRVLKIIDESLTEMKKAGLA
jgi:4-aminobutyrate aminotransferase-like enzyme